ncbi:radical SAM family heme chaperone HemW [candidate division KSB1 bacterium]|jgi:oxygen-independent coproporphyrinogen-3 oxidase|nr:radical SAM family heme chaperone HemW [candidate division KSB1 bacterium]
MRDAALYIHVPFCRHKCVYCDFYSITDLLSVPRFLSSLIREIDLYSRDPYWQESEFSTIFLGGGTPSLFKDNQFVTLSNELKKGFHFATLEFSCESNPSHLDESRLSAMNHAGINRLIIGAQSFHANELEFLQRIHGPGQIETSFTLARERGFDNLGLDLIFAIPFQTLDSWQHSLVRAVELSPEHLSLYGLTFERNTPLFNMVESKAITPCDEELEREMYGFACQFLREQGYEHYEISNFCKPGFEAKHNIKYWDGSPYLGLGPSAHSFYGSERSWNVSDIDRYSNLVNQGKRAVEQSERLDLQLKATEMVMLGLRQRTGIDCVLWEQLVGQSLLQDPHIQELGIDEGGEPFEPSKNNAFLTYTHQRLALTRQGLLIYDSICEQIIQYGVK